MDAKKTAGAGLILGVSSGFGAATARRMARSGMDIYGLHLDRKGTMPQVDALRSELEAAGSHGLFYNVNAADPDQRAMVIDDLRNRLAPDGGPLRLLLHSLAFGALRPLVDPGGNQVTPAQISMTLDVMASSLVFWTQALAEHGLVGDGTRIIAMTSSGARRILPNYGAVSAAKAALEAFVRQLAFELGHLGVRVNAIEAGVTDTPALRKIPGEEAIRREILQRNPAKRLTEPEDVAAAIEGLCSAAGNWINGTTIRVDGGEGVVELDWRDQPS